MRVVASFFWGFKITDGGTVEEGAVFGEPTDWGPATDSFIATVTKDWPDEEGPDFSDWTVIHGACCDAPSATEPATWGTIKAIYE